jgi:hypothetical protein
MKALVVLIVIGGIAFLLITFIIWAPLFWMAQEIDWAIWNRRHIKETPQT